MAANVVGFVDIDSNGIEGLEAQYDEILTGVPGRVLAEKDPGGRVIPSGRYEVDPAIAGGVLLTTVTDVVCFMTFLGLATLFLLPG